MQVDLRSPGLRVPHVLPVDDEQLQRAAPTGRLSCALRSGDRGRPAPRSRTAGAPACRYFSASSTASWMETRGGVLDATQLRGGDPKHAVDDRQALEPPVRRHVCVELASIVDVPRRRYGSASPGHSRRCLRVLTVSLRDSLRIASGGISAAAALPTRRALQRAGPRARVSTRIATLADSESPKRDRAISSAAMAASHPLFPCSPPARASACSMVSVVSTPNATGTSYSARPAEPAGRLPAT